jgi:hypothetical protein
LFIRLEISTKITYNIYNVGFIENLEDMAFLEQNFTHLPSEGKRHLKAFLEGLVSLQSSASQTSQSTKAYSGKPGIRSGYKADKGKKNPK